jgi:ribonuclease P protein component
MSASRSARFGRLVQAADFERVLRTRSRAMSVHFAVHHINGVPGASARAGGRPPGTNLSTGPNLALTRSVDDPASSSLGTAVAPLHPSASTYRWLGAVVPKRHARRAVTRSLLKRQIRAAVDACAQSLPAGLWVVRLRAGFDRLSYRSAASAALQRAVRDELDHLLERCAVQPRAFGRNEPL